MVGIVDDFESSMLEEISMGETNRLEFKGDLPKERMKFIKTVVAFSNGSGGRILFGVRDDHEIVGIPDDSLYRIKDAITDSIYKSCHPVIVPEIYTVTLKDRNVLVVDVQAGDECPYFIKSEGLDRGVYMRISGTSVPADSTTIKILQMRGKKLAFDVMECPSVSVEEQELDILCRRLSSYRLPLTPEKLENFDVIKKRGRSYVATNAYALLTSNPFLHARIQCARFRGNNDLIFIDSTDLEGDVVSQIEGAMAFVLKHLNMGSRIQGLIREDFYEIPEVAVREAIVNAVVHREYMMDDSSIFVKVFDDRVEIESPGLPLGLDVHDVMSGRSKIRNQALASVFKAMGLIERYGGGVRRMVDACVSAGLPAPEFIEDRDYLIVRFTRPVGSQSAEGSDDRDLILTMIRKDPRIRQKDIAESTGMSLSKVKRIVADLRDCGKISREGNNRNGKWVVRDQMVSTVRIGVIVDTDLTPIRESIRSDAGWSFISTG